MKKIFLVLLFFALFMPVCADTIFYTDGTRSDGKIIKEKRDTVIIREITESDVVCETEVPREQISRIEKGPFSAPKKKQAEKIKKSPTSVQGEPEKAPEPLVRINFAEPGTQLPALPPLQDVTIEAQPAPSPREDVVAQIPEAREEETAQPFAQPQLSGRKIYSVKSREDKAIEIRNNVKMRRMEVAIILPNYVSSEQLGVSLDQVLADELRRDKLLDALWITAYRQAEEDVPMFYAIWAPPGGWDDFQHTGDKGQYRWEYRRVKDRL